jgi:GxxExxY protein
VSGGREEAQEAQKMERMGAESSLDTLTTISEENDRIFKLCDVIRETSFAIHKFHRYGHLESVYENALCHRLRKVGLLVEQQFPMSVYDEDGTILGKYVADLFVEHCLIVEIKACRDIIDQHIAQVLGYLRSSRIEHGLLINFGNHRLQIKKLVLSKE